MARSLLKLADLVALPFGNTPADARSVSTSSMKPCDSGYSSDIDQGTIISLSSISGACPNKHLDKLQSSNRPKKDPDRITVRHEHMLYGGLALSILGLIDKNLITPVVMGMAGAALLIPIFRPTIGLERVLDLSAFRFQSKREAEVRDVAENIGLQEFKNINREVIVYLDRETVEYVERHVIEYVDCDVIQYIERDVIREVEKPVHHYIVKTEIIEKPVTRFETVFVQTPTPDHVDAGVQANFTPKTPITKEMPVPRVEQKKEGQTEKKDRKHRGGKKHRKQHTTNRVSSTITASPIDPTSTLAATSGLEDISTSGETPVKEEISSTSDVEIQPIFIRTTAAQKEGMRIAQEARDRTRKPGGIPPRVKIVKDEQETDLPLHEHDTLRDLMARRVAEMDAADQEYLPMPQPYPGSHATRQKFDPLFAVRDSFSHYGQQLPNPHTWGETPIKHLFVSITVKGAWLYLTPEASYVFRWHVKNSVWYCEDYGFGFYQTEREVKKAPLFQYFYADLTVPNRGEKVTGVRRSGRTEGPFWAQAIADCAAELEKNMSAEQKAQRAAQKMQQEAYEQQIKAEEFKRHFQQQEDQWRADRPAPHMPKQFDGNNPSFRAARENYHRAHPQSQQTPQMPKQSGYNNAQYNTAQEPRQAPQMPKQGGYNNAQDRNLQQAPQMPKQFDFNGAQYRPAQPPQKGASPQSRPKARAHAPPRAPKVTLQQTAAEDARKAAERVASWASAERMAGFTRTAEERAEARFREKKS